MSAVGWDWILGIIVAAFVAWEAIAKWVLDNREGHTLSNRILLFVKTTGWPGRILVAAACIALGVHLEGGF